MCKIGNGLDGNELVLNGATTDSLIQQVSHPRM